MKWIDQIFTRGIKNTEMEYSDAHWQHMKVLLQEHDNGSLAGRKKTYRRITVLLIIGLVSLITYNTTERAATSESVSIRTGQTPPKYSAQGNEPKLNENTHTLPEPGAEYKPAQIQTLGMRNDGLKTSAIDELSISASNQGRLAKTNHTEDMGSTRRNAINKQGVTVAYIITPGDLVKLEPKSRTPGLSTGKRLTDQKLIILPEQELNKWTFHMAPHLNHNLHQRYFQDAQSSQAKYQETPVPSFGYGIEFWLTRKNWGIKSGIESLNLYEKTNYVVTFDKEEYTSRVVRVTRQFDTTLSGSRIDLLREEIDTTTTRATSTICAECLTEFRYLNIPIAYERSFTKGRFGVTIGTGVQVGFLLKASGTYAVRLTGSPNTDDPKSAFGELSTTTAVNPMLWQANGYMGLRYRIHSNITLWGNASYSRSLNSVLTPYSQQIGLRNIRFGIAYNLGSVSVF